MLRALPSKTMHLQGTLLQQDPEANGASVVQRFMQEGICMSLLLLETTHIKMRDYHSSLQLSLGLESSREELDRPEGLNHYLR